jgi:hypothetical protein
MSQGSDEWLPKDLWGGGRAAPGFHRKQECLKITGGGTRQEMGMDF